METKSVEEILNEIYVLVSDEKYEHFFLLDCISKVRSGEVQCHETWSNILNQDSWVIGLLSENYYLYGKNWTTEQLYQVNEVIGIERFKNYHFIGTKNLLNELLNFDDNSMIPCEIYKLRNFYRIRRINFIKPKFSNIREANTKEIEELAIMRYDYYIEEYEGKVIKDIHSMESVISNEIKKGTLYVILDSQEALIGSCSIMDYERIGILFVKSEYRKKGYGKKLLGYVTHELLLNSDNCYLMTEKKNIGSNKVVETLGYVIIYEHSDILINICG